VLGGMVWLTCGFEEPGQASDRNRHLSPGSLPQGCQSTRFVASLSDGSILTNFWVDGGTLVRIDQYPAHPIDL
jgi:hypothetical protein